MKPYDLLVVVAAVALVAAAWLVALPLGLAAAGVSLLAAWVGANLIDGERK